MKSRLTMKHRHLNNKVSLFILSIIVTLTMMPLTVYADTYQTTTNSYGRFTANYMTGSFSSTATNKTVLLCAELNGVYNGRVTITSSSEIFNSSHSLYGIDCEIETITNTKNITVICKNVSNFMVVCEGNINTAPTITFSNFNFTKIADGTNNQLNECITALQAIVTNSASIAYDNTSILNDLLALVNSVGRIEGYTDNIEGYIDGIESSLTNIYNDLHSFMGSNGVTIDTLNSKLSTILSTLNTMSSKLTAIQTSINTMQGTLNNINGNVADIEAINGVIASRISTLITNTSDILTAVGNISSTDYTQQLNSIISDLGTLSTINTNITSLYNLINNNIPTISQSENTYITNINNNISNISNEINNITQDLTDNLDEIYEDVIVNSPVSNELTNTDGTLTTVKNLINSFSLTNGTFLFTYRPIIQTIFIIILIGVIFG